MAYQKINQIRALDFKFPAHPPAVIEHVSWPGALTKESCQWFHLVPYVPQASIFDHVSVVGHEHDSEIKANHSSGVDSGLLCTCGVGLGQQRC